MEFEEVITSRHSVRDFQDKQIDIDLLKEIVSIAQGSPSWGNSQPVKVYMVVGEAAQKLRQVHEEKVINKEPSHSEIEAMSRDKWPTRNQEIMANWTTEFKQQFAPGQVHFNKAQTQLFHAPAFAFITVPQGVFDWAIYDAGAFATTLMYAARNKGVDSIVAYSTVIYPDEVREIAHISDEEKLVVGIALGYASTDPLNTFVPTRETTDEILSIIE